MPADSTDVLVSDVKISHRDGIYLNTYGMFGEKRAECQSDTNNTEGLHK